VLGPEFEEVDLLSLYKLITASLLLFGYSCWSGLGFLALGLHLRVLFGRVWLLSNVFDTFGIFKGHLEGICESALDPLEKLIELFDILCLLNCGQNLFSYSW
jgi:hypothetical protein